MPELVLQVSDSADDCHVNDDGSGFNSDGSKVIWHSGPALGVVHAGLRWVLDSGDLPPGSTIHSATLEVYVDSSTEDDPFGFVKFVKEANPAAFNGANRRPGVDALPLTTAEVVWTAFGVAESAAWVPLSGLGPALQEACSVRSTAGGSLALVMTSVAVSSPSARDLRFRSYDHNPSLAAKLTIDYTAPVAGAVVPYPVRRLLRPKD